MGRGEREKLGLGKRGRESLKKWGAGSKTLLRKFLRHFTLVGLATRLSAGKGIEESLRNENERWRAWRDLNSRHSEPESDALSGLSYRRIGGKKNLALEE